LIALEYFFDADPGFGQGTTMPLAPDSTVIEDFIADIADLGVGEHFMFIRVKDENNKWSHCFINQIYIKGLQIFLEGPFDNNLSLMKTELNDNGLLPLDQPFDSNPTAEWYYEGDESVVAIPNINIVDWLLLQTRDATSPANTTSSTVKENQVAFLLKDGKIVGLDGESLISFSKPIDNNLYLVVFHRNHLGIMSSSPIDTSGEYEFTYNFSTDSIQVYGGSNGYKKINSGVWGMISGDSDGMGEINNNDLTDIWNVQVGNSGYLSGDNNLNGQVENNDKNDNIVINENRVSQIPE